jgi:choline-glycine betaine transporter
MYLTLLPHCDTVDISAFLIILVTAKRQGRNRHPGISSILDTILREATLYFLLMFASQFLFVMFLFFAPVGDI